MLFRSIGLAWRLQRGTFIAWSAGLAIFGAMYGSIIPEIETFIEGNEFVSQSHAMMGSDPVESFMGIVVMLLATVSGGYAQVYFAGVDQPMPVDAGTLFFLAN